MVEGEEELLASSRHAFAFLLPMLWIMPAAALGVAAWAWSIGMGADIFIVTPILWAWLLAALGFAMNAFIEWRYNFVVVTTEKLVIVDHRFIFSQVIKPVPLETIQTTDSGSQYLGIGHCGYVNLHLSEVEHGTNRELRLDRMPKPDVIAGVIENARSLKSQRSPADKGTASQSEKVEEVQGKTAAQIPETGGAPPPPEPAPPQAQQEQQPVAPAAQAAPAFADLADAGVPAPSHDSFDEAAVSPVQGTQAAGADEQGES